MARGFAPKCHKYVPVHAVQRKATCGGAAASVAIYRLLGLAINGAGVAKTARAALLRADLRDRISVSREQWVDQHFAVGEDAENMSLNMMASLYVVGLQSGLTWAGCMGVLLRGHQHGAAGSSLILLGY